MQYPQNPALVTSAALPYLLSLPDGNDQKSEVRPLLCFLHGYDEGAPMPIKQALTRHGPWRAGSSSMATSRFVVVAPQMPLRGDLWHEHASAVQEIVQQVQARHGCDLQRTYLTGFSFGGNGVFDLGLQQPQLWRALWPVDPTRAPDQAPAQPVWLSSGQISRRFKERFIERLKLDALEADDKTCRVQKDRVYVDRHEDHVGTAKLAYRDDRIYEWLLSH